MALEKHAEFEALAAPNFVRSNTIGQPRYDDDWRRINRTYTGISARFERRMPVSCGWASSNASQPTYVISTGEVFQVKALAAILPAVEVFGGISIRI